MHELYNETILDVCVHWNIYKGLMLVILHVGTTGFGVGIVWGRTVNSLLNLMGCFKGRNSCVRIRSAGHWWGCGRRVVGDGDVYV